MHRLRTHFRRSSFALATLLACVTGCTTKTVPTPVGGTPRVTRPVADASKTLTVLKAIDGYGRWPPSRGLRFPIGVYTLEAEDSAYWYLRSEKPLEISFLQNLRIVEVRRVSGGIMISKAYNNLLPAAGYVDDDLAGKSMIWELGREFLYIEGKYWTKNF